MQQMDWRGAARIAGLSLAAIYTRVWCLPPSESAEGSNDAPGDESKASGLTDSTGLMPELPHASTMPARTGRTAMNGQSSALRELSFWFSMLLGLSPVWVAAALLIFFSL